MIPWKLLAKAQTPGDLAELSLWQRDTEFSIKLGNDELMNSYNHGSEDALGTLACQKIRKQPGNRVLVGGLGMGFTLRCALDELGDTAQVVVAEFVEEVVDWNRGVLAHLADSPVDDRRVKIQVADVTQVIKSASNDYDAIMLDVDNGPQAMTSKENDWLYSLKGLQTSFAALRPKGVLAIWSTDPSPAFSKRLSQAGFQVDEVKLRSRGGKKGGGHFIVWVAQRS
ncbi:MAG: MnmC family methyltransferase [Chloroflexi bacterium]|nr:MnmC family methyltransferase [Chloroflexota bacterium]